MCVNVIVASRESKQESSFLNASVMRKASVEAQAGPKGKRCSNAQV